jgi:uncharacterized protein (TIGR02996 family)
VEAVTTTLTAATDLDCLHAALDKNPADQGLRLVLSDWYEERGDADTAECLRWTAAKGRVPFFWGLSDGGPMFAPHQPWAWGLTLPGLADDHPCSVIRVLFDAIRPPPYGFEGHPNWYATRRAAEAGLAAAWASLSPAGRATCWAWQPPCPDKASWLSY